MKFNKNIFFIAFIFLTFGFILRSDGDIYFEISKSIDIFGEVYKQVTINYVDNINPQKFMEKGIEGMLSSLDPYSNFYNYEKEKDVEVITNGKYGGIGATVGLQDNQVTIMDLLDGYPAQIQGLRIGDVIVKIDSIPINESNYEDLGSKLKGEPGSFVKIKILRQGEEDTLSFNLVREEIILKNITYCEFFPKNSNNLYIKLTGFTRTAGTELRNEFESKQKEREIKSVILDLRGNPGGLLDAAIDISEKFLNTEQLIVSVANKDSVKIEKYYSKESPIAGKIPLVILINGNSASASEIVAGAIQDHDRGVIVGETSFGKGLVQSVIKLPYNNTLKLTTGKYYTPSGRLIQKLNYNNKVLEVPQRNIATKFKTDNGRIVMSAGGITPDSVVKSFELSPILEELLSSGMFFKFASHYFNENEKDGKIQISKISDNQIFELFKEYLNANNFDYLGEDRKAIEKIEKSKSVKESKELSEKFAEFKSILVQKSSSALNKEKQEIVKLIKLELVSRSMGLKGKIEYAQGFDEQLATAVKIIENTKLYNKILKRR